MASDLNFIDNDDISGKKKGARYGKYVTGVEGIVEELLEQIEDNGSAIVSVVDIATMLDMKSKSETAIHRGIKFALWSKGIVVDMGTHKDNSKVFIFKEKTDKDVLPDSLQKLIDE